MINIAMPTNARWTTGALLGVQIAAVIGTSISPVLPFLLLAAAAGGVLLFYFHQILLILLANEPFLRRLAVARMPFLEGIEVSVTVLLSTAVIVMFLWRLLQPRVRSQLLANWPVIAAFLAWVLWMLAASAYAPNATEALVKSSRFAFFNTLLFLGPLLLVSSRRESRTFLTIYLSFGLMVAVMLLAELIVRVGGTLTFHQVSRLNILSANPIGVARVLATCGSMAAIMLISSSSHRRWWVLMFVLFLVTTLLTGSRGPLLSLTLGSLLLGVLLGGVARRRTLYLAALVIGVVGLVLTVGPEGINTRYKLLLEATDLVEAKQGVRLFNTVSHRLHMWSMALGMWTQDGRHFLFGDGPAAFARFFPWRDFRYPHNLPLEVLAEFGLLGALVFSSHLLMVVRRTYAGLRAHLAPEERMWLAGSVTFLITTMVSGDLDNNRFLWFFVGGLVATLSLRGSTEAATTPTL